MKTFFNVLYRRILYKIPLKWILVFLAVFAVCFASYSNAWLVINTYSKTIYRWQDNFIRFEDYSNPDILCLQNINNCAWNWWVHQWSDPNINTSSQTNIVNSNSNNIRPLVCIYTWYFYNIIPSSNSSCQINVIWITSNEYTSLQCQTSYSLIPISSVDQNYCTTNNLCPSCPECETCSSFTGTVSNVYINGINHLWAPNIVMNIAEEIDWDYAYTTWWQNMNIDVVWYNVDYEKMQSVIDLQNYKPTDEDFSSLVSMLAPYTKIIIFFVFLFLIWAWIKKPFRSKKL